LSSWACSDIGLLFILSIFAGLTGCAGKSEGTLHLIVDSRSAYAVVIPQSPSVEEIRAAEFLRDHLAKISDCELPIVDADSWDSEKGIFISKNPEISNGDGFAVFTQGESLFIHGGLDRGCIYGVADMLEKYFDVRYFSPQAVVIPRTNDIALPPLDIRDSPVNSYRNVHGDFSRAPDYKDFHRLHTVDDMFPEGYYVHTFHRLLPWAEYFERHPEYYAWMNGKRVIDQICPTHPEVYELVKERLSREMARQPDQHIWSVSQDDNFSYCRCDECAKIIEDEESPAGPILRFVNRLADEFPDKVISTLAYQYSRKAPVKTVPRSNVQIMLCTIELNRSRPIADDPGSVSFLRDLEDWVKIAERIYLWDYTVNFSHSISPFPNLHVLQPNIQLFAAHNIKEHFQQSNTGTGHEFSELKSFFLAKLLWNPDADVTRLIREFTDGYYGPAGRWIRKYLYAMENRIRKTGERLDIYGPPVYHQNTFLSAESIGTYNTYFDRAEKAVGGRPDFLLRVKTARMPVQYAAMEIGKNDMFGPRGWYRETDGGFEARCDMVETLEEFYRTSLSCRSAPVNESELSAEEYYQSTKRFVDVQIWDNPAFRKRVAADPPPSEKYGAGDLGILTNGVRGAHDFKVHWLGWEAQDFSLILDMEKETAASRIEISTLYDPKSWILHPLAISCWFSDNGTEYLLLENQIVDGDQRSEEVNRLFTFQAPKTTFRYLRFDIKGTRRLFDWHPSAGGDSWVFVDEIVVR
jgi:hypothetical protein